MAEEPGAPPEDVLTVLIDSFDYYVATMAEVGVELRKSRHSLPVLLPYGVDFIPQEVVGRLLSHCDFAFDAFWAKLEEYQATPE